MLVMDTSAAGAAPRIALPHPEVHVAVRFGAAARGGLDLHALGPRQRVHRKLIRDVDRLVIVRLPLGGARAAFGVHAGALVERVVALEDLWGDATTRRLCAQLAGAPADPAAIVERAIAERIAGAADVRREDALALRAAERLASAGGVRAAAGDLGVSERHLRRVFRETIGVSPKAFAQVTRFRRALRAARADRRASWASIAAATGYCDQAHLIDEFRAIAGVTPRALLDELAAQPASLR